MANEEPDFVLFEEAFTRILNSLKSGRVYLVVDNASCDRTHELCDTLMT
jgi:hypothetical protein